MENPIKTDDLGVPPFKETPIWLNNYLGGGNSKIFSVHPETWGRFSPILTMHIFQMGWFNHQLVSCKSPKDRAAVFPFQTAYKTMDPTTRRTFVMGWSSN